MKKAAARMVQNFRWITIFIVVLGQCLGQEFQPRIYSGLTVSGSQQQINLEPTQNQECAFGYYKEKGWFLTRCVPCNCNGHSNRCQDDSGICINCKHNTAGDSCEHCEEGYFGNATQGSCDLCPCPLSVPSNSFATGCTTIGGVVQCMCRPGYTGPQCERCAPGFFGNPRKRGSTCSPCNCGNSRICDHLTGECTDEPKDTGTDNCDACDSCVSTLLSDLDTMNSELQNIKTKIQNANTSSQALERMRKIEELTKATKILLDRYRLTITSQKFKINELESDSIDLNQDINTLEDKAAMNSRNAQNLLNDIDKTKQRADDLVTRVQIVLKNIQDLLKQLTSIDAGGGVLPSGEYAKRLTEAERMMREMRNRNFNSQKIAAENERNEAQNLLSRVKNELLKRQEDNQELARKIRDSLSTYESKLADLREALAEATEVTKQASDLNNDNSMSLKDIKSRIRDLEKQQRDISDGLTQARESLKQTNDLLRMLDDSQEEYEKLAAQLDGAKQELNDKVQRLSQAARKEPLVVRAEKHALALQDLANQLAEMKKNVSSDELVRKARDAAKAYGDIIDAVRAAEEAANKAGNAASKALETVKKEGLPENAKNLKSDSSKLLDQAKEVQSQLQDLAPGLQEAKTRLADANRKKDSLENDLQQAQAKLRAIKRDDIADKIATAKNTVENANKVTDNVVANLQPIKDELNDIKNKVGSSNTAEYDKVLASADSSVKTLTSTIPELLTKLNSIHQQLMPLSNISENVNRIRELIQQARDAADKVSVPMRFNGSSGVEVRPPSDLDDLKAYTSLSLYVHQPQERGDRRRRQTPKNMFVMYLGNKDATKDYIGMAIRDGALTCIYNLGGVEKEIVVSSLVSTSDYQDSVMDYVKFERIYQYAVLTYVKKPATSDPVPPTPIPGDTSYDRNTLLNLEPNNVVFYVGGHPPDFKPPPKLNLPFMVGCIELNILNEKVVSLYNFKNIFDMDTTSEQPCKRQRAQVPRYYFEGTGYAGFDVQKTASSRRYEAIIETTYDKGLLLFMQQEGKFFSIELQDGFLVVRYKTDSEVITKQKNDERISDGKEQKLQLVVTPTKGFVVITNKNRFETGLQSFNFEKFYLGGLPADLRERFNITAPPFRGFIRDVKIQTSNAQFSDTVGISRKSLDELLTVRSATVSKGGQLNMDSDGFPFPEDFHTAFGFRTQQPDGVLLRHKNPPNEMQVVLDKGFVKAKVNGNELISQKPCGDGQMHYVSLRKESTKIELLVDDELAEKPSVPLSLRAATDTDIAVGGENFDGCITNVFIQRTSQVPVVQNLAQYKSKTSVSLGSCAMEKPPQSIMLKETEHTSSYNSVKNGKGKGMINLTTKETAEQALEGCALPSPPNVISGAYRFGDSPASHLEYAFSPELLQKRSHFSIDVRASTSDGLIFYAANEPQGSFLALYLSNGRFVFSFGAGGRRTRIKSKESYIDQQWHTVVFSMDGKNGRLVIDGLRARDGTLASDATLDIKSPFYLGGVPSINGRYKLQDMPRNSFLGCAKNFKVNGRLMNAPSQMFRVIPCFEGNSESGVYFSAEGGYVVLDNSFVVGENFELLFEIRPRNHTGVLFHISSQQGDYLSLYMDKGKLTVHVNNGAGDFSTSVTPQQSLCDGQWHTIALIKGKNVVQLDVDTETTYTIGPQSALSTDTKDPLYVGGIPDTVQKTWLPARPSFVGCLRKVKINEVSAMFSKAVEVHGAVSLSMCPN